jgi:hypothetical protein
MSSAANNTFLFMLFLLVDWFENSLPLRLCAPGAGVCRVGLRVTVGMGCMEECLNGRGFSRKHPWPMKRRLRPCRPEALRSPMKTLVERAGWRVFARNAFIVEISQVSGRREHLAKDAEENVLASFPARDYLAGPNVGDILPAPSTSSQMPISPVRLAGGDLVSSGLLFPWGAFRTGFIRHGISPCPTTYSFPARRI